jgi:hypothetical protein
MAVDTSGFKQGCRCSSWGKGIGNLSFEIEEKDPFFVLGAANGDTVMIFQQYLGLKYRIVVFFDLDLVGDPIAGSAHRGNRKGSVARKVNGSCLVFL